MANGFVARLLSRNTHPSALVIIVRWLIIHLVSLPVLAYSTRILLNPLLTFLVFSLSCLLQLTGVKHTWYKWMLTIDGRAVYVSGEMQLALMIILLAASLLWISGSIKKKLPYLISGTMLLYLVHVLALFIALSKGRVQILLDSYSWAYLVEYILVFMVIRVYVRQNLLKQVA